MFIIALVSVNDLFSVSCWGTTHCSVNCSSNNGWHKHTKVQLPSRSSSSVDAEAQNGAGFLFNFFTFHKKKTEFISAATTDWHQSTHYSQFSFLRNRKKPQGDPSDASAEPLRLNPPRTLLFLLHVLLPLHHHLLKKKVQQNDSSINVSSVGHH